LLEAQLLENRCTGITGAAGASGASGASGAGATGAVGAVSAVVRRLLVLVLLVLLVLLVTLVLLVLRRTCAVPLSALLDLASPRPEAFALSCKFICFLNSDYFLAQAPFLASPPLLFQ
jgi:hypothetical protein